jgi:hypothetical protein
MKLAALSKLMGLKDWLVVVLVIGSGSAVLGWWSSTKDTLREEGRRELAEALADSARIEADSARARLERQDSASGVIIAVKDSQIVVLARERARLDQRERLASADAQEARRALRDATRGDTAVEARVEALIETHARETASLRSARAVVDSLWAAERERSAQKDIQLAAARARIGALESLAGALERTSPGAGGTSWKERAVTGAIGYGVLRGVEELVKAAAGG